MYEEEAVTEKTMSGLQILNLDTIKSFHVKNVKIK